MTILDRLLGRPEPRAAKAVTSLGAWGTSYPLTSLGNDPQVRAAAYLKAYKVGWFNKAGRKIGGDFANLPWHVADGDIESDDENETKLGRPDLDIPFTQLEPIDQFQRLMEKPNPDYSGRMLREKSWIRYKFAGAAFLYLEGGQFGLPTALYGISPARMWPSRDRAGNLIGWVMDKDKTNPVPFDKSEIMVWSAGGPEDDPFGVGVVEAIYSQVPLTDLMARHTANVLLTGGRLAGMMWPKERALDEDEFTDAQRAWRNVASDPDAGKRLLIFPEPMEYAQGASTPAEIGIPELASLNRDEILTGFNLSPYRLGVPTPGGLNSGEVRREDRRDYWEDAVGPDVTSWDEFIQTNLVSRYEEAVGRTYAFTTEEPNLDDASTLLEKAGAFKALASIGFDHKAAIDAAGLAHIKWLGMPEPEPTPEPAGPEGPAASVSEGTDDDRSSVTQVVAKATKARADVVDTSEPQLARFLVEQSERITSAIRDSMPRTKAQRSDWAAKADPSWWDKAKEDKLLREVLSTLYLRSARGSLQVVADELGRIVPNRAVGRVVDDLVTQGGERIVGINETTKAAVQDALSEGTRRGYSLNQLIDGVEDEGFRGVRSLPVFDEARAETIARTETMLSYNRAALDAYGEFGVEKVLAYDGDEDPECAARDGQEFTVEEALAISDHPNGTLDWAPVV